MPCKWPFPITLGAILCSHNSAQKDAIGSASACMWPSLPIRALMASVRDCLHGALRTTYHLLCCTLSLILMCVNKYFLGEMCLWEERRLTILLHASSVAIEFHHCKEDSTERQVCPFMQKITGQIAAQGKNQEDFGRLWSLLRLH